MEFQNIFNFIGSVVIGVIGWWCRQIWDSIQKLKDDVKDIEVSLPNTYVKQTDINARLDRIDSTLERIFDKLDEKADK